MGGERVVVVGAGIGGLVAALELAAQGMEVVVVEQAAQPGGKMREVMIGGQRLDAGPTVLTMRWVFDELFARLGTALADHLTLRPASVLARHAWGEQERLDLYADIERSADAIGAFAGPAEKRGYLDFCRRARRTYQTMERPFLRGSRPNPISLTARVGLSGLADLARIAPFSTLWRSLGDHFTDPRLRQLFGRYATYCGSSPFSAPATLMLVAHVEQDGVWMVEGGMHRIAVALAALGARHGVLFRYGARVSELVVSGARVSGVRLETGEQIDASAVVFNGDVAAIAEGRLGIGVAGAVKRIARSRRSLSAVTWNKLVHTSGFPLLRHNVFFCNDYAAEFHDIFRRSRLPADPTVYVCAQDRDDVGSAAPPGAERLLCLINAPPTGDTRTMDPSERASCEQRTLQRLARSGLTLSSHPGDTTTTAPEDFERLFPATGGALYGQASHGWMASFSRPGSRSRIAGLYLAGGSAHPGPGVPMAALSGRLAAASLLEDRRSGRASIGPLRPAAMPGGTSMP